MNTIKKVVPIILKKINAQVHILVFRHPLAGIQIVKDTVEINETLEHAALRELLEESGIQYASIQSYLGRYSPNPSPPHWHIFLCQVQQDLAETWSHFCQDDGGLTFQFFWHPLNGKPNMEWHPIFQGLFSFIQLKLK